MSKSKKTARQRQAAPRKPGPNRTPRPRTPALPGLEDHSIPALDRVAAEYAGIRDERMELTEQEVALKTRAMSLMKQHGKTTYKHDGIEIAIDPGEESIKVRVVKVKPLDEDADAGGGRGAPVTDAVGVGR
jgi:hypothetical protein